MKIKLEIHTFLDTMNIGGWIGSVETVNDGPTHGYFVEGRNEAEVLASITDSLSNFIHKLKDL